MPLRVCVCACATSCADASTLALVAEKTSAHSGCVKSVSFSPDGMRIVSGSGVGNEITSFSGDNSVKVLGARRSLALCCRVLVVAVSVRWRSG